MQYFINRITFVGNTTTHDNVIRRELRLVEDGIFNTEALKYSVKRLNQLGYFKPLEAGKDISVDKTPGETNKVDVKLKLEEQNRNQISFGAGVSEFEGFFGQASFQTSNFLGRGESLTVSLSAGSRAQNYTLAFTEPFLFDRNMTGSVNLYRSDVRYIGQFTQRSAGGVVGFGYPLGGFTRLFTNYSYEQRPRHRDQHALHRSAGAGAQPVPARFAADRRQRRAHHQQGHAERRAQHGRSADLPEPGRPLYGRRSIWPASAATPLLQAVARRHLVLAAERAGCRSACARSASTSTRISGSQDLPIFQKLFLGGEYSVRGFDIRSIGPQDPVTGLVLGGNKSLLFNIEQNFNIMSQFRIILFYDAGQVRDVGAAVRVQGNADAARRSAAADALRPEPRVDSVARSASAGSARSRDHQHDGQRVQDLDRVEARLFMPVINVPFRLIFAYNPQRAGVLGNDLQPQKAFQFRFAVGTTF